MNERSDDRGCDLSEIFSQLAYADSATLEKVATALTRMRSQQPRLVAQKSPGSPIVRK